MTTYFIIFANVFEAAAFKEYLYTDYRYLSVHYFNCKGCSVSAQTPHFIYEAIENNILSSISIIKHKQVHKGITKYKKLKF